MFQVNNIFKGLTQSLQPQQSQQAQPQRLEDLINRSSGLGKNEKEIIFNYVRGGEDLSKQRKDYITNIIIIFNSFFEYGFLRKSSYSGSSGYNARSSSTFTDEWADGDDSNQLGRIEHYWEYITMHFIDLDSVKYINFYYEDASTNREKALGWILLALNQKDELKDVVMEIFGNIPILQLYSKEESYLWQNRKEILQSIELVYQKNMYNPCPLLDNFLEFGRKKEEKLKGRNQFMMLLENKDGGEDHFNDDADFLSSSQVPTPSNTDQDTHNFRINEDRRMQQSPMAQQENFLQQKPYISQSDGGTHREDQKEDIISDRYGTAQHARKQSNFIINQGENQDQLLVEISNSYKSGIERVSNAYLSSRQSRINSMIKNSFGQQSNDSQGQIHQSNTNLADKIQEGYNKQESLSSQREMFNQSPSKGRLEGAQQFDKVSLSSKPDSSRYGANEYNHTLQANIGQRLNLFSINEFEQFTPQNTYQYAANARDPHYMGDATEKFWINDQQPTTPFNQFDSNNYTNNHQHILSHRFFVTENEPYQSKKKNSIMNRSGNSTSPYRSNQRKSTKHRASDKFSSHQYDDDDHQNQQQSLGMEESRRVLDKIFTDGEILIPPHARRDFKMIYEDKFGKQRYENLSNSDIVYLNEYYDIFKFKEYTYQKKELFMRRKELLKQHSKKANNVCWNCFKRFDTSFFGLVEEKDFCHFCMDFVCHNCVCKANMTKFIPNEVQLKFTICQDRQEKSNAIVQLQAEKYNGVKEKSAQDI